MTQAGRVHLGDGGGGERCQLEYGEELVERAPEVLLDDPPHRAEGLCRHMVAQQPELGHELLGKEALSRREDLAQLDVRRAKALEGSAQAARQARP